MTGTAERFARNVSYAIREAGPIGTTLGIVALIMITFPQDMGVLVSLAVGEPFSEYGFQFTTGVRIAGLFLLVVAFIAFASARYLRRNDNEGRNGDAYDIPRAIIDEILAASGGAVALTDEERRELIDAAKTTLEREAGDRLLDGIEEKYGETIRSVKRLEMLKAENGTTRKRLQREIGDLARRGNLNLVIGISASLIGILFLGATLIGKRPQGSDVLTFYLSRTTFVVLIELIAFFFLNLYRGSLEGIKYFQNELTNVELRFLGLEIALLVEDQKALTSIANQIASTDRNFVLKKGESTVEIEKLRSESTFYENLLQRAASLIPTAGAKK